MRAGGGSVASSRPTSQKPMAMELLLLLARVCAAPRWSLASHAVGQSLARLVNHTLLLFAIFCTRFTADLAISVILQIVN